MSSHEGSVRCRNTELSEWVTNWSNDPVVPFGEPWLYWPPVALLLNIRRWCWITINGFSLDTSGLFPDSLFSCHRGNDCLWCKYKVVFVALAGLFTVRCTVTGSWSGSARIRYIDVVLLRKKRGCLYVWFYKWTYLSGSFSDTRSGIDVSRSSGNCCRYYRAVWGCHCHWMLLLVYH